MRFSRCVQNKKVNEDPISADFGVCCWGHDSPEDPSDMPMCARKMEGVLEGSARGVSIQELGLGVCDSCCDVT